MCEERSDKRNVFILEREAACCSCCRFRRCVAFASLLPSVQPYQAEERYKVQRLHSLTDVKIGRAGDLKRQQDGV